MKKIPKKILPKITNVNSHPTLLLDLKKYPNNPEWQDQHRWRVSYRGVYRILKQIKKYLIVKQEKAELVINHYDKIFSKKTFGKGGFGVK